MTQILPFLSKYISDSICEIFKAHLFSWFLQDLIKTIVKERTVDDVMRSRRFWFNKKHELTKREKALIEFINSHKTHTFP